ncbi:WAS protein family-like protein 1-like [Gossypium australe]|uniref:WAS protein family-like protein 1-like n=1 Tax=Gossypium australe TaxID=47621 RepID=A0A5B6W461_9ROSI|nr:WAS protein family-like protein 1-like [Gossypium australe]
MTVTQQPPPPPTMTVPDQQPYHNSQTTTHPSLPLIGVLLVIIILGIIAGMIGRLCTGRKIMGLGHFDIETWIETKCSSCIDGRVYPPPPPPPPPPATSVLTPPIQRQPPQQEDQSPQNPTT